MRCGLLASAGIPLVAGPGNPNHPCPRCRSQWRRGAPPDEFDAGAWPAVLQAMAVRHAPRWSGAAGITPRGPGCCG
jgi:hypothetical protein